MDCTFYEVFQEEEELLKKLLPSAIKAVFTSKTIQEDAGDFPSSALISIRTQSTVPEAWAKKLKGILTRSAGYDHLKNFLERAEEEVPCGYLPLYCARAVAEQAMLMTLALLRKMKKQMTHVAAFNRDGLTGLEVKGRHLLVAGVGHIGGEVVELAKGLGMVVKGIDIEEKRSDIEYTTLFKGLSWADVIVCSLPLTWLTRRMFSYETLNKAKPGALFINIARGEISPLRDLQKLLEEGVLGGLGLDVYDDEASIADFLRNKRGQEDPDIRIIRALQERDDCILTPHNAFNTLEAVERKARQSVEAVENFLTKGRFPHPVPKEIL